MPVTPEMQNRIELSFSRAFDNTGAFLRTTIANLQKDAGAFKRNQYNMVRLDKTLRGMRVAMEQMGYRTAIRTQLDALLTLLNEVLTEADKKGLPAEYTTESQLAIRMLMIGSETELTQIANAAADTLGQLMRQSVLNGGDPSNLITDIQTQLDIKKRQAVTLAHTALAAFNSSVTVQHAKEAGVEWFAYLGPDDGKTREWCDHWVGMRGKISDFQKTANQWGRAKQPGPVEFWRGGYNCRHRLEPVFGKFAEDFPVGPR